jgi:hypothetical protein
MQRAKAGVWIGENMRQAGVTEPEDETCERLWVAERIEQRNDRTTGITCNNPATNAQALAHGFDIVGKLPTWQLEWDWRGRGVPAASRVHEDHHTDAGEHCAQHVPMLGLDLKRVSLADSWQLHTSNEYLQVCIRNCNRTLFKHAHTDPLTATMVTFMR